MVKSTTSRPSSRRRPRAKPPERPRDPEATRAALLAAAADAFERSGFAGARIDRIAEAARVNKALIRYHFGGKRGLYNSVLREGLTAAAAELERATAATGDSAGPDRDLTTLIEMFARFYTAKPDIAMMITREQMDGARNLERATVDALFAFFNATRRLLERGIAAGRLRNLDPHHVHLALVGSLIFFRLTAPARTSYSRSGQLRKQNTGTLSWSDHVEVVKTILLHGLELPGPGAESDRSAS